MLPLELYPIIFNDNILSRYGNYQYYNMDQNEFNQKLRIEKVLFHKLESFYKKQWIFKQNNNSCYPMDLFYLARKNNPLSFFQCVSVSEDIFDMVDLYAGLRLGFENAMRGSDMDEDEIYDWLFVHFMYLGEEEFPAEMYQYENLDEFKRKTFECLPQLSEEYLDEVWYVADEILDTLKTIPKAYMFEFWNSVLFNFIHSGTWSGGESTMIILHCPIFKDWMNYRNDHKIEDGELEKKMECLSQIFSDDFFIIVSRFEPECHYDYYQDLDIRTQFLLAEIDEILWLLKKKYRFSKKRRQRLNSPFMQEVEEVLI